MPTLCVVSKNAAKTVRKKIYEYSRIYSSTLMQHLSNETEVKIVNGEFTEDSETIFYRLNMEMKLLQYKERLGELLQQWSRLLGGQPLSQEVHIILNGPKVTIIAEFDKYIGKLQAVSIMNRHAQDKLHCNRVCESTPKILNLSSAKVPSGLEQALENGSNFVPQDALSIEELQTLIEKDLINAAINYFRDKNKIYPLVNTTSGLKSVLEQLISQTSSNSCQVEYYSTMYDSYFDQKGEFYKQHLRTDFIEQSSIQKLVPKGTILAEADKGLGPCLLPIEWFI